MDCSVSKSAALRPAGQQAAGNEIRCMGERCRTFKERRHMGVKQERPCEDGERF